MGKTDPTPLDYFLNQEIVDMAVAHFLAPNRVVELAHTYISQLQRITAYLNEAKNIAQRDEAYRKDVRTYRSRDCFLLMLGADVAGKVVTQLQARLEFEGLQGPAFLSVSEELLRAQRDYQSAFSTFNERISST